MTSTELAHSDAGAVIEAVIVKGDLSKLTPEERVKYYSEVCRSQGLNPFTRPFEYLSLQGKTVLYATRGCADQLRRINNISLSILSQRIDGDLFTVHVKAEARDGRIDEDFGVVNIGGTKGVDRANQILKGITKAKRRVTLSICGLGFMDESEVDDIAPRPDPPQSVVAELDSFAAAQEANRLGLSAAEPQLEDAHRLAAEEAATKGTAVFREFWRRLGVPERALLEPDIATYRRIAEEADEHLRADDPFGLPPSRGPTTIENEKMNTPASGPRRSAIWDDPLFDIGRPKEKPGGSGLEWDDWTRGLVYLIEEANLLELEKLLVDNKEHISLARRESGDHWREIRDADDARRQALAVVLGKSRDAMP